MAKARLSALLSEYPGTRALRRGEIDSATVTFDFAAPKVLYEEFRPLIRGERYDVAELPVVTYLQAHQYQKDLTLLPFVMNARFQHDCLVYNASRPAPDLHRLRGKRIGVRSYTQTTVAWIRAILRQDFGLDPHDVEWITTHGPHLDEFDDPPVCRRAEAGKTVAQLLLEGDVDIAVLAPGLYSDPLIKPVFSDGLTVALDWHRRTGVRPINHMAVVTGALARERPGIAAEILRMLTESRKLGPLPGHGVDLTEPGIEPLRPTLEAIIAESHLSGVIDRPFTVDEIFAPWREAIARLG